MTFSRTRNINKLLALLTWKNVTTGTFFIKKNNLIILLKVNDFTKAWFLQGREWYSGKWMIISNCEHSFVYFVKWHFLNKQSTSTINSVGDILLRWRHSNEPLNFLTLSIFLVNKNFQSNVTFQTQTAF